MASAATFSSFGTSSGLIVDTLLMNDLTERQRYLRIIQMLGPSYLIVSASHVGSFPTGTSKLWTRATFLATWELNSGDLISQVVRGCPGMNSSSRPPGNTPNSFGPRFLSASMVKTTVSVISLYCWAGPALSSPKSLSKMLGGSRPFGLLPGGRPT